MNDTLTDLLAVDLHQLKTDVDRLRAIEKWARDSLNLDYATGDRVQIISERPSQNTHGWACYVEALAVGQTGIAGSISFNSYHGRWDVLVGMDRCWSVHKRGWPEQVYRSWCGPASEAPEGFEVPLYYPPEGKTKWFGMPVSWVRRADS